MLERVTFGITSFERPQLLERLVGSIKERYPTARILVADNGRRKASLPGDVRVLNLEFDSGLSAARNALLDNMETEFLLLLEEDFLFTDETRIEPFVEVLDTDHEVGFVGGSIRGRNGRRSSYALDIDVFRDVMYVQDTNRRMRFTPYGTGYRICDIVWNFGLIRKQFLDDHRWDDRLKVGEHAAYFHQVKLGGRWRVASCPAVTIYHVPDVRSDNYLKHRQRGQEFFHQYMARNGLKDYRRVPPVIFEDEMQTRPNVVVLGVGHSGTSILTRMMAAAGWDAADADEDFAECVWIRDANMRLIRTGEFDAAANYQRLQKMPQPWVIKDPRFVHTLHYWLPLFAELEQPPVLVRIQRDANDVKRSYLRRDFRGNIHDLVDQRMRLCEQQYQRWPWGRMAIDYEQLGQAAALFSHRRAPVNDVPSVWPPGPLGQLAGLQGQQPGQAAAQQDGSGSFVPGWQATTAHNEDIERHDTDRLDFDSTNAPQKQFVPGWQATAAHNEDIERHDTDRLDFDNVDAPPRKFVPGWQATAAHNEDIERHDTDRLDFDSV